MPPFSAPYFIKQQQQHPARRREAEKTRAYTQTKTPEVGGVDADVYYVSGARRLSGSPCIVIIEGVFFSSSSSSSFLNTIIMVIAPPAVGLLLAGIQVNGVGGVGSVACVVGVFLLFFFFFLFLSFIILSESFDNQRVCSCSLISFPPELEHI